MLKMNKLENLENKKLFLEKNKSNLQKDESYLERQISKVDEDIEKLRLLIRKARIIKITTKNSPFTHKIICEGCNVTYSTKKNPDAEDKKDRPQCKSCGLNVSPKIIRRRNK